MRLLGSPKERALLSPVRSHGSGRAAPGRFPAAGRRQEGSGCRPPGPVPVSPGTGSGAGSELPRERGREQPRAAAGPERRSPGARGAHTGLQRPEGRHGPGQPRAAAPERIQVVRAQELQLSNAVLRERGKASWGTAYGNGKNCYFLQIRNTCLLVLKMVLCFNSLKSQHYHLRERKRTVMMISVYHRFSTQKRQIIKLIAEYRYIAKVVWFHNILSLLTILPLHNFTNYLKMFLLKANMIYTNLSEAAGIQTKSHAFTV